MRKGKTWLYSKVALHTLKDDSDKKLAVLGSSKQIPNIIATEISVDIKALIEKQINELFAIRTQNGVLEYVVLNLDLSVIVTLKDFR